MKKHCEIVILFHRMHIEIHCIHAVYQFPAKKGNKLEIIHIHHGYSHVENVCQLLCAISMAVFDL